MTRKDRYAIEDRCPKQQKIIRYEMRTLALDQPNRRAVVLRALQPRIP